MRTKQDEVEFEASPEAETHGSAAGRSGLLWDLFQAMRPAGRRTSETFSKTRLTWSGLWESSPSPMIYLKTIHLSMPFRENLQDASIAFDLMITLCIAPRKG